MRIVGLVRKIKNDEKSIFVELFDGKVYAYLWNYFRLLKQANLGKKKLSYEKVMFDDEKFRTRKLISLRRKCHSSVLWEP